MYQLVTLRILSFLILLTFAKSLSADGEGPYSEEPCTVCACSEDLTQVDCSGRRLSELPTEITEQVTHLNLANNEFTILPNLQSLYNLQSLDLSGNELTLLPADALLNLTQLESLNLAGNSFTAWSDLRPSIVLVPAEKLLELDLSNNHLQKFSNLTEEERLVSNTLETLIINQCGISAIENHSPISGLTKIKTLKLSGNPIHKFEKLASPTLQNLDMSHCSLNYIHHLELAYLPALLKLEMAHNYRLLITTTLGNLTSDSLKELDISYCNIDKVVISGFPNLKKVNMTANMIRSINANDFYNNTKLDVLDMSYNSISSLNSNSFRGLIMLKHLNLTANQIREVPEDVFVRTVTLLSLSLSRNFFTKVNNMRCGTLQSLDFSMCELDTIDKGSLENLWSLKTLNLSRNLLGSIPDSLSSDTLTTLDLSNNRLSTVTNNTFYMLPRLMTLSVSGNRFSAIWKRGYFDSNRYIERVDMSDNTWRCECAEADMFEFYEFLTLEPSKLEEAENLECHSPANVTGMTWQAACDSTWFPTTQAATGNETIILCFTVIAISLACCAFVVLVVRRMMNARLEIIRQERERQAEEARERLRRLRMQHEQQAQCNAPDPRDLISPPSYDEALLMPRPASTHSLNEAGKTKRKRGGRRRAKSSGDVTEDVDREDTDDERRERRKRRSRRYGSHELKELDRSPRAPRRGLSMDDQLNNGDVTVQMETDSDAEVAHLMAEYNRNVRQNGDVRESDF